MVFNGFIFSFGCVFIKNFLIERHICRNQRNFSTINFLYNGLKNMKRTICALHVFKYFNLSAFIGIKHDYCKKILK